MKEKIKSNQTVVLVSHQEATIKKLCTHVLWIEDGCVKKFGNCKEVLKLYESSQ